MAKMQEKKPRRTPESTSRISSEEIEIINKTLRQKAFKKIAAEWAIIFKEKSLTPKGRSRARFLLLSCYRPFQDELKAFRQASAPRNSDESTRIEATLRFTARWYVDTKRGIDCNELHWKLPAAFPINPPDDDHRLVSSYADDAIVHLIELGHEPSQVCQLSDNEALTAAGFVQLYVNFNRTRIEIGYAIATLRAALKRGWVSQHNQDDNRDSDKAPEPVQVRDAIDHIGSVSEFDPLFIALFSVGIRGADILREVNKGKDEFRPTSQATVDRRITELLKFIDPLNYGELTPPGKIRKSKK